MQLESSMRRGSWPLPALAAPCVRARDPLRRTRPAQSGSGRDPRQPPVSTGVARCNRTSYGPPAGSMVLIARRRLARDPQRPRRLLKTVSVNVRTAAGGLHRGVERGAALADSAVLTRHRCFRLMRAACHLIPTPSAPPPFYGCCANLAQTHGRLAPWPAGPECAANR